MPDKTYDFYKILAEYNKKHDTNHYILPDVTNVLIIQESSTFYITYRESGHVLSNKYSVFDFLYYYVRPRNENLSKNIILMLQAKEEDKLSMELKILPPNKIRYAYLDLNYFSGAGILGSSCMRHKDNQKSLNFYVKNNVQIVVAIDGNNKIHARALLWPNVKSTDRKNTFAFMYLDRVYSRSSHLIEQFYTLAKKNKWKYYASTSAGKARATLYIDDVNLKGICHLPYTDTFRYLFYKDNFISASTIDSIVAKVKDKATYTTLTNTGEGGYVPALDPDRVREVFADTYISKKDAVRVSRYKGYVLKRNIVDINGDYYSKLDKEVVKSKADGYILIKNSVDEVVTSEPIDKTKAVYSKKHNGYIHKENVVYIKDEMYHVKDKDITRFDNKWYHISDCFKNYDREKLNEEITKQLPYVFDVGYHAHYVFRELPTVKGDLVPKKHAIITYDLVYNPALDKLIYQEVYFPSNSYKQKCIKLNTGVYIRDSSVNRKHLKKFNNKYYIKQEFGEPSSFEAPNKHQLTFNFKDSIKCVEQKLEVESWK